MSDKVLMYTFATPGPSESFRPLVSLKGFEKIESKDSTRFHQLMNDLKYECLKMGVHFQAQILETKDLLAETNVSVAEADLKDTVIKFKPEIIKEASSSKAKLVFVKVPDSLKDLYVNNTRNVISGHILTTAGSVNWVSPKLPDQRFLFVGYSHKLTDEEIESICSSRTEFYDICNHYGILYNYSAYTGKWAVLAVR